MSKKPDPPKAPAGSVPPVIEQKDGIFQTAKRVAGQGVAKNKIAVHVRAHIRYAGTDTPLIVEAGSDKSPASLAKMKIAFERVHKAQFGFIDRGKELVIEAVSVEDVRKTGAAMLRSPPTVATIGAVRKVPGEAKVAEALRGV